MRKIIEHSILVVLLLPLLFINIKTSHDWGDDFAQYIHQAKNIVSGISQNQTGYIFNKNCFLGPQAYPVGFPLMLSAVIAFKGVDLYSFNLLISLFLVLSCFMGYLILRNYTSYLAGLFSALIIAYNPALLIIKSEVLSDIPFTFFSLWCIYLLHKKETFGLSILLGILIGFTIHIRAIGFVLLLVYAIQSLLSNGFKVQNNIKAITGVAAAFAVYLLIKILVPYNANYPFFSNANKFWFSTNKQLSYNVDQLSLFMEAKGNNYFYYIGIIASCCLIAFGLLGFLSALKTKPRNVIIMYLSLYVLVIAFFPYGGAGIRFIIPILFFVFMFAITGMSVSLKAIKIETKWLPVFLGCLILFSYNNGIAKIIKKTEVVIDGPQLKESVEVFEYINKFTEKNAILAFDKPRALALYTERKCFTFTPDGTYNGIRKEVKKYKVNYILIDNYAGVFAQQSFLVKDATICEQIFTNNKFSLYKVK